MPLRPDLSYTGLDEFDVKPVVENKSSEEETTEVKKNTDAPIIKEWVSDDKKKNVTQPKIEKKTIRPNIAKKEFVKPRQQEKTATKTFWSTAMAKTIMAKTINGKAQIHARVDAKEIIITESSVRRGLRLADEEGVDCLSNSNIFENLELMGVVDEAVYKELDDRLVRAATIASSLEAEHDSGNIDKTQSKETPNEASSLETTSSGGPRCQEAIGDTIAQTRFKNVSKLFNDSLLVRDNTLQSNEDRMKLNELMKLCTNLQTRVLDLEKTKTTQALEITSLKKRVKKLEKKKMSRTHKLKRLYKVGLTARVDSSEDEQSLGEDASKQERKINDINADEDITLVNDQDDAKMFDVNNLHGEEVFVVKEVADKETSKPKAKRIVLQEPNESITTTTIISSKKSQDKGKAIMIKEPVKPKKKVQLMIDEETAKNLQDEFDEEERVARKKAVKELKANNALIEEYDDIQA
nr:hypothetical protein [Tanacetum cinerariifolium]